MDTAADTASPEKETYSAQSATGKDPCFKRAYQACENCRQKKQKCSLGDPANPKRPCKACRRANLTCVLPERRRKGRPSKKFRQAIRIGEASSTATTITSSDSRLSYAANGGGQAAWPIYVASFTPAMGNDDGDGLTRTPCLSRSPRQTQPTTYDQRMASQTLATFPLRNTSDAIRLLDEAEVKSNDRVPSRTHQEDELNGFDSGSSGPHFFLLREGLINEATICRLFHFYLNSIHPIMPLIPYERIPITSEHILAMAGREPHFMAAILVVTAALMGDQALHDVLWQRVQRVFADVAIKGADQSLEIIEGLLLLSEYPPNMGNGTNQVFEDRMCWMTVGTAVRLGYLLGLEQLSMHPDDMEEKSVDDPARGKVVWAYCFCLERQISIRVGKAFWLRSPGLTYQHQHSDPSEDFPQLREIPGIQDNYAAYLQCLMQITQALTNAHDLLYPSKSRSIALAKAEQYYKHIDEFGETLSAFRNRWQTRPWQRYPINECVWISFHHLRLYIYSFSLQGHMQRVSSCSDGSRPMEYFPTGLMGCVDARFIIEAINAAADILRLAIGRLQPSGALSYLPLRYFLYFCHAGVFLLKSAMIVPLPPSQKRAILRLIRALIKCMSTASSDPKHPGVRYSSALERLLGRIYRNQELQSLGVTRPPSPRVGTDINANSNEPAIINTRLHGNDLSPLLGSKESPFVAERPLQALAADIDALFDFAPDDPGVDLQLAAGDGDLSTILPPSDIFAPLFSNYDQDFWEPFTPTTLG
ncbi:hypothetical protein EDD36DRAFT_483846 [Exophiala viscosa]|uniref:Zn(2)-C6 fungal-type domain-containing protein n=1 Tax=Exophiala viscosa TaxID=2486360 RepID=A0AAN6II14_9EURO|nr:hypothetical protein EDD36DRAFT_483846 [Exophiala viscosa]